MYKTLITASILAASAIEADAQTFIGRQTPKIENRTLTPEALWAMGRVGGASVSPDNKQITYNVSYYSVAENKSHTVIYVLNTDGTGEKLLTEAKTSEIAPKYIDGGRRIAFLGADSEGNMQVFSMLSDGNDRRQLSNEPEGVDDFSFSPDEKKVILIKTIKYGKRTADLYPDLTKSSGRVITDLMHRHWDEWVETIPHSYVADYDGAAITGTKDILEGEPYECPMKPFGGIEQLAFSPDSKEIAYTCRKLEGKDYACSTDADIYIYNIETGETRNICKGEGYKRPAVDYTESLKNQKVNDSSYPGNTVSGFLLAGYDTNPSFSPDGKYIAWQSMERDGYESDNNRLLVMELATGRIQQLAASLDTPVDSYTWSADGKSIYFIATWHGTTHVYSVNMKDAVKKITDGQYDYNSVSLCGRNLLCGRQSMCESRELYLVDPSGKKPVAQLTHENQYFCDNIDWGTCEARWTKTVDGKDLHSWVILPPNFDKTKKYPTLLFCEGGPQSPVSQFWSYRWNMMIMAANGYVVVAPNRRGLPGFGKAWLEEISEDYGGHCMDDYFSAIDDAANNLPYVDKNRLGCVGASFGGYSVYWIAGHHDKRFKAFIAHDGIFNMEQQYLETEEMWFANWDMGGAYWNGHDKTFKNSPHRFVDKWDTPILCIQGEKDYRIVTSQAMSAFNAAQLRGIPSEFLCFPDENHWVLKPQNGILWQRRFFNWLDRYVK
ncbi:MAG: S9 family peptidase [Bacteroidaceae bacterium]|nr:S9 family peptidase [Bacteroidaceae bacterium]